MGRPGGDVLVLLSAYNGASYIEQQIESIRAQSFRDWTLIVRDDASSDDTAEIVSRLCERDARISLLRGGDKALGPWASFGSLLSHARDTSAQYFFLSDQDDVCLEDKMSQQLALLRDSDKDDPHSDAMLVHSDLILVDEKLRPIHHSFSEFQGVFYASDDPLGTLMIHNAVAGCTVCFNRALLDFATPIPANTMHDWWLALCASAIGRIRRTPEPTVLYRQHSSNVIGVEPRRAFLRDLARNPVSFSTGAFRSFSVGVSQARELSERMRSRGFSSHSSLERIDRYCNAFSAASGMIARLRSLAASRPKPRRTTSKIILRVLSAVYPWAQRAISDQTNPFQSV